MPPQPETGGVSGARRRSERRSAGAACGRSLPVQRLPGVWLSVHMPLPAAVRPALVGRDREQAELATALAGARAGHGRAVLLLGEAGMGKSVLADWLAGQSGEAGVQGARGRVLGGGYAAAVAMAPLAGRHRPGFAAAERPRRRGSRRPMSRGWRAAARS